MKSLKESLFDTDLVQRELAMFGEKFAPSWIGFNDGEGSLNVSRYNKCLGGLKIRELKKLCKPASDKIMSEILFPPEWQHIKYSDLVETSKDAANKLSLLVGFINSLYVGDIDFNSTHYLTDLCKIINEKLAEFINDKKVGLSIYPESFGGSKRIVVCLRPYGILHHGDDWNELSISFDYKE